MARLQFNDTTNKKGIIQLINRLTNTQDATSSSYPLLDKTVDVNAALGMYQMLAIKSAGRWQVDDTNQTDYPIIFTDIVSGQQDYSFLVDQNDNQIWDIYKVRLQDNNGNWKTLTQRDLQDGKDEPLNSTQTGTPTQYDLTANGIFLTVIPNFSRSSALEVYIARAPDYFVSTDTTKVPGIPEIFHEYLAYQPAFQYAMIKGLPQAKTLGEKVAFFENLIGVYHSNRNRDEKRRFVVNNRGANSNR